MKRLRIHNLVLIDSASLEFGQGLNILTGETGSGKSAILSALCLIAGDRADSSCIRSGAQTAVVEVELDNGSIIRREIHRSGKNRCFIDDALVSLSELKQAIQIEMVDQSSSILGQERQLLDQFAHLTDEVNAFQHSLTEEHRLRQELNALLAIPKEQELQWAEKDLQAIVEVRWKEEEKIAQEHHLLTHAQELSEKVVLASSLLEEALPSIKKASNALEHATRLDGQLASLVQSMRSALLELDEAVRSMQSYASRIEVNPDRLEALETEIGKIVALKRRFGPDLESQKQKLLSSIEYLTHLDVGGLEKTLAALQTKNASWKQSITAKRRASAPSFTALVLEELKSLNLPHAQFTVSIEEQIQFLFSANPGHPPLPLEKCASGGELSRLLLAIKTILSAGQSTLVFDEIDSNVGGQTASAIGEKLKRLAQSRQVICVTHFVQVAKYGNEHFLVSKQTREDHTYTLVHKMSESEKQREYNRMIGS